MKALDILTTVGFAATVIALAVFVFKWSIFMYRLRRLDRSIVGAWRNGTLPIKGILFFAVSILLTLLASSISASIAHDRVLLALRSLSPDCTVSINGEAAQDPAEVLRALAQLQWLPAHHSSPTNKIQVDVRDGQRHLILWLGRDSDNAHEYWVFVPRYWFTPSTTLGGKDIGRVVTPVFDPYE